MVQSSYKFVQGLNLISRLWILSLVGPIWIFHRFTAIAYCSALASVGFIVWNGESHIFFNCWWMWRHSSEICSSHLFPFRHYGHFNRRTKSCSKSAMKLSKRKYTNLIHWNLRFSYLENRLSYRVRSILISSGKCCFYSVFHILYRYKMKGNGWFLPKNEKSYRLLF